MMLRREEFAVLEELRKTGALPQQLEERYQKLRREQFFKAGLQADQYPPPSTLRLEADMTVTDWLRDKWVLSDETIRHSLQILADALGIDVPLIRTRHSLRKDSSPPRRAWIARHTSHADLGISTETQPKERGYHDPPAWDDDDADGWTPSEGLHDALHESLNPEDRGWS